MAELASEHDDQIDITPDEVISGLESEVRLLRRALNQIIMLELTHSGTRNASVIQQACDIARVAIYGRTRKESELAALGEEE
jgi:hypothetical protein